jgi:ribosome-associated protein
MEIPLDQLRVRYVRSGGPGGQNVNKVATKAEVRFRLTEALWIPGRVRARLKSLEARRLNQRGDLVIVSSRFRTRHRNLEDCLEKLRRAIARAEHEPKKRVATRPTRASKERRLTAKKQRAQKKQNRTWQRDD